MRYPKSAVVSLGLILATGALSAYAFSPLLFMAAQVRSSSAVLVRAQVTAGQATRLVVLRTVFGSVQTSDVVVEQANWLSGSKVVDRHVYLVLLGPSGEPYRGLLPDGTPTYFCGVINTLEVQNEAVTDSHLYDSPYIKQRVPAPLAEIERALRKAHGVGSGV